MRPPPLSRRYRRAGSAGSSLRREIPRRSLRRRRTGRLGEKILLSRRETRRVEEVRHRRDSLREDWIRDLCRHPRSSSILIKGRTHNSGRSVFILARRTRRSHRWYPTTEMILLALTLVLVDSEAVNVTCADAVTVWYETTETRCALDYVADRGPVYISCERRVLEGWVPVAKITSSATTVPEAYRGEYRLLTEVCDRERRSRRPLQSLHPQASSISDTTVRTRR